MKINRTDLDDETCYMLILCPNNLYGIAEVSLHSFIDEWNWIKNTDLEPIIYTDEKEAHEKLNNNFRERDIDPKYKIYRL